MLLELLPAGADAVIVQLPGPERATEAEKPPFDGDELPTEHDPEALKLTVRPELAVAETVTGELEIVYTLCNVPRVIVWLSVSEAGTD